MGQNPSGGMIGGSILGAAGLMYRVEFQRVLDGLAAQKEEQFAFRIDNAPEEIEWDWLDEVPGLKKWLGDREMSELKAQNYKTKTEQWARGIRIKVNDMKRDKIGLLKG